MRCAQCEFENMPGLVKCMRCGSVLKIEGASVEIYPPRAPSWKKPIRAFFRYIRQDVPAAGWSVEHMHYRVFPEWLKKISRAGFFGAMLSFVPGLAHVIQKRFGSIKWFVAAWLVLLSAALFFYGSGLGMMLLGTAIGVHVWIAVHSAILKEYDEIGIRIVGFLVILFFFFILYHASGRVIFRNIRGGYSSVIVSTMQVQRGDYLLGHTNPADLANIHRGDFVLARLTGYGHHFAGGGLAYVQVIGLPEETVGLKNGVWSINSASLDPNQYPVQSWLVNRSIQTNVPQDNFFISALFEGTGYNEATITNVCVIPRNRIEAKAFLRWMPLSRRGFIREME